MRKITLRGAFLSISIYISLVIAAAGLFSGCLRLTRHAAGPEEAPAGGATPSHETLTIAGSTSVQPFAELLAESFMKIHGGVSINVQGGGSSAGARAAMTGVAGIGAMSRELAPEEKSLHEIMIARDGIAIIVHPDNPVDDLTLDQVRRIFSGEIKRWSEVGGPDKPIHVVSREEGSGTRGSFDEMVMHGREVTPAAVVQDSNGAVRETVAGDKSAIGYISLGLVDKRVKGLKIDGVEPSVENVRLGRYSIARPFLFVTRDAPQGLAKEFIDFVLSPDSQAVLLREGLVPVK
ncbi:MAG TPA: phosphate ABC transporter substrate-binding protein [Firmicutes bacterium]|nr:phosphate ABC transporter substrate-binding protein [Bacillota bacterium]